MRTGNQSSACEADQSYYCYNHTAVRRMAKSRDDFPKPVVDVLAKRAAFICSNPDCRALTVAPSEQDDTKFLYIGKAAHICAAAEGGPRYDATMSPEDRKSASNGIFLCSNCADMIDKNNGFDFPVDRLQAWKNDHEKWVAANLNKQQAAPQPSAVTFNVMSVGQQGGITAGVVNVGPQPRNIDDRVRRQLAELLPDKSRTVTITSVLGDGEAYSFATQIKDYLASQGYGINGVNQAVFTGVVPAQAFDPDALKITIGSRQ